MDIPGYKIEREIGKGGMATVYLAIQESLNRSVVLKILDKVQRTTAEDLTERFIDEGRIVASLNHPNIVTIYDIGVSGDDMYISMEYVKGGDLKQRLEQHIKPAYALGIVFKIGNALAIAHRHGVIHRDVKPGNILFRDEDTPLLTDFGIAKQMEDDKDLTSTGIFLGSPNYVSPEQADGKQIDGRADIYSLGCIFYEMLTGYKPYHSDSVIDIVIQHKTSPIPALPEKLQAYQPLLNKMMAKDRNERFQDAESMARFIETFNQGEQQVIPDFDVTGHTPSALQQSEKPSKRSFNILIILLVVTSSLFAGLEYVDIKFKNPDTKIENISTNTVIDASSVSSLHQPLTRHENQTNPASQNSAATTTIAISPEVIQALSWLGKQSLDEYKLTYPPKDNAFYYYSRLLEINPDNEEAFRGILMIAERYAILAERAFVNNEIDKTRSYIEIGLKINPKNEALLSLKSLVKTHKPSFIQSLVSIFK